MAIYDDDFQGYAIGAGAPFGSWLLNGAVTNQIVAGSGPTGTTQSYRLFGNVEVNPIVSGTHAAFTVFCAVRKLTNTPGPVFAFANGPNLSGHTFTLVSVQVEQDATVSVVGPDTLVIKNSIDQWFEYNVVNFFQVNVQLTDVLVLGTQMVNVNCQIGLNGREILSVNQTSATPVAQLMNGTSEANHFQLAGSDAFYSGFTLDGLQSMVSYPHVGTPKARINQAVAEVDVVPTTGRIRAMQAVAEADVVPTTSKIRVIQAVAECDVVAGPSWRVYEG